MGNLESLNNPIIELINKGKNINTDFLLHIENTNEVAQMLVSFANTIGGQLIVGVNGSQKVKGINPIDEKLILEECIKEKCIPSVEYHTSIQQVGRHLLLVVEISKSEFQCKVKDGNGKLTPYYRVEGNVVRENKILKQVWLKSKHKASMAISLSENAISLLNIIRYNSTISLSQLYKLSNLSLKEVDDIVVTLIHYRKIQLIYRDNQIYYSSIED